MLFFFATDFFSTTCGIQNKILNSNFQTLFDSFSFFVEKCFKNDSRWIPVKINVTLDIKLINKMHGFEKLISLLG